MILKYYLLDDIAYDINSNWVTRHGYNNYSYNTV